jgi:RNA polymerase sigma-70 factor, ECF subfamily
MMPTEWENRFEALIRANASDLLAYLERRIDPRADAADVLSETLIIAWKKSAKVPSDDIGGRMWLFTIARNTLLNARRATHRRSAATERLRYELAQSGSSQQPEMGDSLAVRQAVNSLPTDLRELVTLIHWDGFSVAEAAEVIGISASTGRSRYAVAKARLHSALVPEPENSLN